VTLDDGTSTKPADVHVVADTGKHTWMEITLGEGKNRQIHRMGEAIGHEVLKLSRVGVRRADHRGVEARQWRHLTPQEVNLLREKTGALSTVVRKRAAPERKPRASKKRGRDR